MQRKAKKVDDTHETFMRLAIHEAKKNFASLGGGPFGACLVKNGQVIALARNSVLTHDATCHAEMNAIRMGSKKLHTFDLSGCVIYSTTEPCPMCFSAIHWARIKTVYYGTSIRDAKQAGFNELSLSNQQIKKIGKSPVKIIAPLLREECKELFRAWLALPKKKVY